MLVETIVIAHNIRSAHNIGSILRTADGFGVQKVYLTGYSPYPEQPADERLPHLRQKITADIHKTALGAELSVPTEHHSDPMAVIKRLKANGYQIIALEQSDTSTRLDTFVPAKHCALLLGEEVHGITPELLAACDVSVEIPMHGKKESFNVSVAAGIALYQLSLAT